MKTKIHLIGGGFYGSKCSSGLNENTFVEWTKNESESSTSVHIDNALLRPVAMDPNKLSFGWIAESSSIVPRAIKQVLTNLQYYKKTYKYIFAHDYRIISRDPSFFKFTLPNAKPWVQNKKIYKKTKLISFIASNKTMCKGHSFRQKLIRDTMGKVDHFGAGFKDRELPAFIEENGIRDTGKLWGLKDYMFSIAMENANYPDIFTEKITDCFATGTVPVFWGTPNIGNYFDKNGIIMLEDVQDFSKLDKNLYDSMKESIEKNYTLCQELLTAEDYMLENHIKELL